MYRWQGHRLRTTVRRSEPVRTRRELHLRPQQRSRRRPWVLLRFQMGRVSCARRHMRQERSACRARNLQEVQSHQKPIPRVHPCDTHPGSQVQHAGLGAEWPAATPCAASEVLLVACLGGRDSRSTSRGSHLVSRPFPPSCRGEVHLREPWRQRTRPMTFRQAPPPRRDASPWPSRWRAAFRSETPRL